MARGLIIEDIHPNTWTLRLRDEQSGEVHEFKSEAGKPMKIRLGKGDEVQVNSGRGRKPEKTAEDDKPVRARKNEREAEAADEKPTRRPRRPREEEAKSLETKADDPVEEVAEKKRTRKPRAKAEPGAGPGGLVWAETEDDGVKGLAAPWGKGAFKILHAGADMFALFYEWTNGRYEQLSCGPQDTLKQIAGERTKGEKPTPPRTNLTEAAARVACATAPHAPAAVDHGGAEPASDPKQDALIGAALESSLAKLLAQQGAAS